MKRTLLSNHTATVCDEPGKYWSSYNITWQFNCISTFCVGLITTNAADKSFQASNLYCSCLLPKSNFRPLQINYVSCPLPASAWLLSDLNIRVLQLFPGYSCILYRLSKSQQCQLTCQQCYHIGNRNLRLDCRWWMGNRKSSWNR